MVKEYKLKYALATLKDTLSRKHNIDKYNITEISACSPIYLITVLIHNNVNTEKNFKINLSRRTVKEQNKNFKL